MGYYSILFSSSQVEDFPVPQSAQMYVRFESRQRFLHHIPTLGLEIIFGFL